MLLKIAWRNIWRNKRRTFITMASVFFAVVLAVLMRSANTGIYENMVHNVVSFSSGYIQVHGKGYWDNRSIDNSMPEDGDLFDSLSYQEGITAVVPRLESFALASAGEKTKGVLVLGIDPFKENMVTQLEEKVVHGEYINASDSSLLISEGLATSMKLKVGDTLILLSQGYHGASAAGKYHVKGIVRLGSPQLNKQLVSMPLQLMQKMYGTEHLITSQSIMLSKEADLASIKESIVASVDSSKYEVMDWKQMLPELDQIIEGDQAGDYIVIGILYLVIAFGIFGTIMMMIRERMHEFGILVAVGMKKHLLSFVVVVESFLIAFMATIAGMAAALPVILWLKAHPIHLSGEIQKIYDRYGMEAIVPFSSHPQVFIEQALIVFVIAFFLSLYAAQKIFLLKPIEAIQT